MTASKCIPYASGATREPSKLRRLLRYAIRYTPLALLFSALAGGIIVTIRWPWLWYGSRDEYQWHRWLTFTMPPEKVVYDEDPTNATALLALPAESTGTYVGDPIAGDFQLPLYQDYVSRHGGPPAMYYPPTARALIDNRSALVFLHARVNKLGRSALVVVRSDKSMPSGPPRTGVYFAARACGHDECFGGTRNLVYGAGWKSLVIAVRPEQIMRIYAGQPDPNDDAHFTISYEIDNIPGTIDGRLEADDTVTLRVLDGPAASRPHAQPATVQATQH